MGRTDGCTCFGVKTSSEVPVKRYNLLVPDIFPPIEPEYKKQLPNSVQRKIKKLGEYLEKYPERSEKVSRRLDRRLRKDLQSERYGHIQVAVQAYIQLLKGGQSAATQLSKELLGDEGDPASVGVVPLLLKHREPELRMWAVRIIAQFTNAQNDSRFKDPIEEFLDELCSMSYTTRDSLQDHSVTDETLEGMRVASLMALGELLGLNGRTQAIPQYLEQIEDCALENLYYHHDSKMTSIHEDDDTNAAVAGTSREIEEPVFRASIDSLPTEKASTPAMLSNQQGNDAGLPQPNLSSIKRSETLRKAEEQVKEVGTKIRQSMVKMKTRMMDRRRQPRSQAVHADEMAADLLEDLAEFAQDSSTRRRVLENMFRFCDARQHWSSPDKIEACVSIFRKSCTEDHQYFVLFSSFIRHLASKRLSNVDRATLIKFAAAEGELQQSAFAAPSLVFALSELPQYLPHPADSPDKVFLHTSILLCLRRLSTALHDSESVLEAIQTPLERLGQTTTIALATLQCIEVALSVVPSLPLQTHERVFPQALLTELLVVVTSWRDTEARKSAHNMLQTVLSCSVLRESQMESLLSSSWYQLIDTESMPDVMVQVFSTLNMALDGVSPEVARHTVPFAIALHSLSLPKKSGGEPKDEAHDLSPARKLGCLLIADLLFERLSQQLGCPGLMDLSTGAEEHSNAIEAETPSSLSAVQPSFTAAHDNAAAASLASLASAIEHQDEQLIAAQALSHGGVSDSILNPPWTPVSHDKLCRPVPTASPNRFSTDRFMPRINPGEEVLRSLQANFASLAVTTEDVLMTGAVGVGSLVEAAKQAAMETELALHHAPERGQKRSFHQTVQSTLPTSLALEVVLAEL